MELRFALAGVFLFAVFLGAADVNADVFSSRWEDNPVARARLISSGYPDADTDQGASAGVHIEINPGWKTYWRVPGDAGIPPRINWKGSKNVASVEVLWPAPHRFIDKYGMSIGYKDEIVLPLKVVPKDKAAPLHLVLQLDYAVCKEVCLPVEAKMSLEIVPGKTTRSPFKRKLQRFMRQIPQAEKPEIGLRVSALEVVVSDDRITLSFDIENPADNPIVDLFVEGRDELFFGTPKTIKNKGTTGRVEVPVSGVKTVDMLDGDRLRLTLVGKKSAVNQYWKISSGS